MSDDSNKPPATSSNSLGPALSYIAVRTRVKFNESCLKQDKITFTHGNVVNVSSFYQKCFFLSNKRWEETIVYYIDKKRWQK